MQYFSQIYIIFQSVFWSIFIHHQKSHSNLEQCSLCCRSPDFRILLWMVLKVFLQNKRNCSFTVHIFRLCYCLWLCSKQHKKNTDIDWMLRISCPKVRSGPPLLFLWKNVQKKWIKFTGENPCRKAISINLQSNFIEITLRHGCSAVTLL